MRAPHPKSVDGFFFPKIFLQVHSCGLNQAIAISGGVNHNSLLLIIDYKFEVVAWTRGRVALWLGTGAGLGAYFIFGQIVIFIWNGHGG